MNWPELGHFQETPDTQLGIDSDKWVETVKEYSKSYHAFVGSEQQLKIICKNTGKKWLSGMKSSRLLYGEVVNQAVPSDIM